MWRGCDFVVGMQDLLRERGEARRRRARNECADGLLAGDGGGHRDGQGEGLTGRSGREIGRIERGGGEAGEAAGRERDGA